MIIFLDDKDKKELQDQIDERAKLTDVSSPYNFKGSTTFEALPLVGNAVNDTYYCTDAKCKYTWNGKAWYQSSLSESDYTEELDRLDREIVDAHSRLDKVEFCDEPSISTIKRLSLTEPTFIKVACEEDTEIVVCGKNLYNHNAVKVDTSIGTTTGQDVEKPGICASGFIPVENRFCVTFTPSIDVCGVFMYDANKNFIRHDYTLSSPFVITDADRWGAKYIRVRFPTQDKKTVQVELNDTATEYEDYFETRHNMIGGKPEVIKVDAAYKNLYSLDCDVSVTMPIRIDDYIHDYVSTTIENENCDVSVSTLPVLNLTGDITGMDKDNAVSLNYEFKGTSGTCTVKWQGSSSLGFPKKNYTVKFNNAFEAKEGWGSQKKYCFKANYVDPSHLRNIVSAKLWGEVVKSRTNANARLNALVNGGAIDGFPCIIKINGKFKGLYTLNIPKDGWMLGMGSGTNECILCAEGRAQYPSCNFQALEEEFEQGFSLEYITDENNTEWALTSLNSLITSAMNVKMSELDEKIDWDSAIDYYIFSALIGHVDGIVKNYLLSTFDGTKWFFTGYDMDGTFGNHPNGQSFYKASKGARPNSIALNHQMFQIIKVYKKAELKARYAELRNGALSEDNVCYVMENFAKTIPSEVYSEDRRLWKGLSSTSVSNIDQMRDWYRRRVAIIDNDINSL